MNSGVRVGVIGDFNPANDTHRATNAALQHAANALGTTVDVRWVPTPELDGAPAEEETAPDA